MCPRVVRLRRRSGWRRPTSADRVGICRYDTPTHTPIVWACLTTALAHLWVPLEPPNLHANLHQPARALGTDMPDPPSHYSGVATVSGHALGIGGSIMGDPLAPNRVHSRWLGVQVDRQTCRLTPCFLAGMVFRGVDLSAIFAAADANDQTLNTDIWSEQVEGLTGRRLVRVLCAGFLARIVGPPALQRGRIALSARWFAQVPRRDEIYGAR